MVLFFVPARQVLRWNFCLYILPSWQSLGGCWRLYLYSMCRWHVLGRRCLSVLCLRCWHIFCSWGWVVRFLFARRLLSKQRVFFVQPLSFAKLELPCRERDLPMRCGLCWRRRHDVPTMQRRQLLDRRRGQLLSLPSWLLVACGQCVGLELLMQCGLLQRCCCSRTGKITVPQRLDKCT